jgi:putative flippase GtrA
MTVPSFVDIKRALMGPQWAAEVVRYFTCSAMALAIDFGVFIGAMSLGLRYPLAAAAGFLCGLWVAYQLSIRFVFRVRRMADDKLEFIVFAVIGVLGLLLTELLLWLMVVHVGQSPTIAKLIAAGTVFCFNFAARKAVLFTRHRKALLA